VGWGGGGVGGVDMLTQVIDILVLGHRIEASAPQNRLQVGGRAPLLGPINSVGAAAAIYGSGAPTMGDAIPPVHSKQDAV